MLEGLLHTRELGLIPIENLFGPHAWQSQAKLDYVINIQENHHQKSALNPVLEQQRVCGKAIPKLILSLNNPASFSGENYNMVTAAECTTKHRKSIKTATEQCLVTA